MLIRPATAADSKDIARYIVMAEREMIEFLTGYGDPYKAAEIIEEFVRDERPNRHSYHHTLVAEVDGAPAGAAISFPADDQPVLDYPLLRVVNQRGYNLPALFLEGLAGTWYLSTMGVDPACRGMGIGTALMTACEESGREKGFARASLLVERNKPRARALYERLGYAVLEEVAVGTIIYVRMIKSL